MQYSRRTTIGLALARWAKAGDQAHRHPKAPATNVNSNFNYLTPVDDERAMFIHYVVTASSHS